MDYYGNFLTLLDSDLEQQYWNIVQSNNQLSGVDYIIHAHDPISQKWYLSDTEKLHSSTIAKRIIESIINSSWEDLLKFVDASNPKLEISTVPLFNDYYNGTLGICKYLTTTQFTNYVDAGTYFTSEYNQKNARQKYGEEHLKLGSLLGFIALYKPITSKCMIGQLTPLGYEVLNLSSENFDLVCTKLLLRIPIIATLFKEAHQSSIKVQEVMRRLNMKESTINRRTQSVKLLLSRFQEINSSMVQERLSKIYW